MSHHSNWSSTTISPASSASDSPSPSAFGGAGSPRRKNAAEGLFVGISESITSTSAFEAHEDMSTSKRCVHGPGSSIAAKSPTRSSGGRPSDGQARSSAVEFVPRSIAMKQRLVAGIPKFKSPASGCTTATAGGGVCCGGFRNSLVAPV